MASNIAARFGTFDEKAKVAVNPEDSLYPEVLQKILNDDHIVQIGQWIIKLNKAKELVYVLDSKFDPQS